ncbi:hypothetical protein GCM10027610_070720 [Dactylosporangium cerinum]
MKGNLLVIPSSLGRCRRARSGIATRILAVPTVGGVTACATRETGTNQSTALPQTLASACAIEPGHAREANVPAGRRRSSGPRTNVADGNQPLRQTGHAHTARPRVGMRSPEVP